LSKQFEMMKAIRRFSDLAYGAQAAGVLPQQIIKVRSKGELPQIKFIKDYQKVLTDLLQQMEKEFNALRAG
jgi:V/A-type H+-transporting ATPase subunit A